MGKNFSCNDLGQRKKSDFYEWRPIPGIPYMEVSSMGECRTIDHYTEFRRADGTTRIRFFSGKERKHSFDKDGYPVVGYRKQTYHVHRLVALTFIPNPENKPCVNHIDGIKNNNDASNLEWCTRSENDLHAFRIGLRDTRGKKHPQFGKYDISTEIKMKTVESGEGNSNARLKEGDIRAIRELAGTMLQSEIAEIYRVSQPMISSIIRRKSWAHVP